MTSSSYKRGLAAMPAQERPLAVDGQGLGREQTYNQRQHRAAMARNTSSHGSNPPADVPPSHWDDADWDQDHDEAAGHRARRLLSGSNSLFHRFGDYLTALRGWLAGERWIRRLAVAIAALLVIFGGCFGALWLRLGAGPINLEMATPWLAAAIEENIGHGNTVVVGGTQIELAGLDWLDSLSLTGLDGQNLKEIGLKNGSLIIDDQQRGNKWNFENIALSLRRPSSGGVALSVGEDGGRAWSLRVVVGPAENGVRSIDIRADKVSTSNILLALRLKDLTYNADLPLTGELKCELGRDGLPTYFRGKLTAGAGTIIDTDTPDYPMLIDSAEINLEWDSARRVLAAPFKIVSGQNRITLLAHVEPPNDAVSDWQLGFSGGTIVLAAIDPEQPPLIFNRIAIRLRFDTEKRRVLLTQADISNGEIGIAGTGGIDYSADARVTLGFAATPISASALKRMWPILIVPEVREWVTERAEPRLTESIQARLHHPVATH